MERVVMGEGRGWESRDKKKLSIVYSIVFLFREFLIFISQL